MVLFENKKVLIAFISVILFWAFLPLTTLTTRHAGFFEIGNGFAPVTSLHRHPSPPVIRGEKYTDLVWGHRRYSILWLPFWGERAGRYGFHKTIPMILGTRTQFIPLSYEQAKRYAAMVNVKIPPVYPISYWSLLFGWLLFAPLILILFWDPSFYRKLCQFYVFPWEKA